MIKIGIAIILIVMLIRTVADLIRDKKRILEVTKHNGSYNAIILLPLLYILPLTSVVKPLLPFDIFSILAMVCFMPGIVVMRMWRGKFERGYDWGVEISKKLDTIYVIGMSGIFLIVVLPIITYIFAKGLTL